MKLIPLGPGVYTCEEPVVTVTSDVIAALKQRLPESPTRRVRFCAHSGPDDALHEMMIVVARESYVRPHAHPNKSESFHIIEGVVDVVLFDDSGHITEVIEMGEPASGKVFYYRTGPGRFHTVRVRTDTVVIHETTNGPFIEGDAEPAAWAPAEDDEAGIVWYLSQLDETIKHMSARTS